MLLVSLLVATSWAADLAVIAREGDPAPDGSGPLATGSSSLDRASVSPAAVVFNAAVDQGGFDTLEALWRYGSAAPLVTELTPDTDGNPIGSPVGWSGDVPIGAIGPVFPGPRFLFASSDGDVGVPGDLFWYDAGDVHRIAWDGRPVVGADPVMYWYLPVANADGKVAFQGIDAAVYAWDGADVHQLFTWGETCPWRPEATVFSAELAGMSATGTLLVTLGCEWEDPSQFQPHQSEWSVVTVEGGTPTPIFTQGAATGEGKLEDLRGAWATPSATVVHATYVPPGTTDRREGVWRDGALVLSWPVYKAPPGLPETSWIEEIVAVSPTGLVLLRADDGGRKLWALEVGGAFSVLAKEGDPAPGWPGTSLVSASFQFLTGEWVAMVASASGETGVWRDGPGGALAPVTQTGDAALEAAVGFPVTGLRFPAGAFVNGTVAGAGGELVLRASGACGTCTALVGVDLPKPALPDLAVLVAVKASEVRNEVVVDATVTNQGAAVAAGVTLVVTPPDGTTYTGPIELPAGCEADPDVYRVVCDLGDLAPGATSDRTIRFWITESGAFSFAAEASSPSGDSDPENDAAQATWEGVFSDVQADLVAGADVGREPGDGTREATVRVYVENLGPDEAREVVLSYEPSEGVEILEVPSACAGGSCELGTLMSGEDQTIELLFRVTRPGGQDDAMHGVVSAATFDPDPDNNAFWATHMRDAMCATAPGGGWLGVAAGLLALRRRRR